MSEEKAKVVSVFCRDTAEKEAAHAVARGLGIPLTVAINVFVLHFIACGGFDFEMTTDPDAGCADTEPAKADGEKLYYTFKAYSQADWEKFQATCRALGVTTTAAVRYFLMAFIACGGFPFLVLVPGSGSPDYRVTLRLDSSLIDAAN